MTRPKRGNADTDREWALHGPRVPRHAQIPIILEEVVVANGLVTKISNALELFSNLFVRERKIDVHFLD